MPQEAVELYDLCTERYLFRGFQREVKFYKPQVPRKKDTQKIIYNLFTAHYFLKHHVSSDQRLFNKNMSGNFWKLKRRPQHVTRFIQHL